MEKASAHQRHRHQSAVTDSIAIWVDALDRHQLRRNMARVYRMSVQSVAGPYRSI